MESRAVIGGMGKFGVIVLREMGLGGLEKKGRSINAVVIKKFRQSWPLQNIVLKLFLRRLVYAWIKFASGQTAPSCTRNRKDFVF